jgi:hypothetical protein
MKNFHFLFKGEMVSHKWKQKFRVRTQDIAKIIMDVRNYNEAERKAKK